MISLIISYYFRYKHAIDGIIRIIREEGYQHLFRGGSLAVGRSILMTIGQLTAYDHIKNKLFIQRLRWKDNIYTHFTTSFTAVRKNYAKSSEIEFMFWCLY